MKRATIETIAFYAMMPSMFFFAFSMFMWRGFYLIDRNSINPVIANLPEIDFQKMYWLNFLILALTIISIVIFVAVLLIYVFSDKIKEDEAKTPQVASTPP
jgi:hypothetical protein